MSKTQIDRLGQRLKEGTPSESDLRLLDDYRRSFGEASMTVARRLQEELTLAPTARPAKSTPSIIDKLRRESIRLTQIQDIAGCRIVVADIIEQDKVVVSLEAMFLEAAVVDRRKVPSFGYRAVHVIAKVDGVAVEIQVRTLLQHLWAEFSEKLADLLGSELKYGGGPADIRDILERSSRLVADHELTTRTVSAMLEQVRELGDHVPIDLRRGITELQSTLDSQKIQISAILTTAVDVS